MLDEPLGEVEAKQLAIQIISDRGGIRFTGHARDELRKDDMDEQDAMDAILKGVVDSIDFVRGTWRYRFRIPLLSAVIGFRSETQLVVITAWRNR